MAKWMLAFAVAFGMVLGLSAVVKAADAKITVKGVVQDKDGKAVEGATVRFAKAMQRGAGGARPEPLATATTDKDGKFTLEATVPDGDYSVGTMVQDKGYGRDTVVVKDGKADKAEVTLKLADRPAGKKGKKAN
jgi:hypothetical protein